MNAEMKSKICKDAEAKLAEAMLAMYQHTHTHTLRPAAERGVRAR